MTLGELMAALQDGEIRVSAVDGRLIVDAPRGVLTAEIKAALVAHKPELLAYVSKRSAAAALDRSAGSRRYREVLAGWPCAWREVWGHLANALEDACPATPVGADAEIAAFLVIARFRVAGMTPRAALAAGWDQFSLPGGPPALGSPSSNLGR
jgi:hypothetical protein